MRGKAVKFERSARGLVAHIEGELDHHAARRVREEIDRELLRLPPHTLILELSDVGFMDSSGIALIIGRAECAASVGAVVVVSGLAPALLRLVRLSGIEKIKNLTGMGGEK